MNRFGAIVRVMRPAQWVKNLFVFVPLFFGGYLFDTVAWKHALLTFCSFSLMASAIYIFNDIRDRESDKLHPVKRFRPLASGALPIWMAVCEALLLIAGSVLISWFTLGTVGPAVSLVIGAYLLLNICYTLGLKNYAIVDVFIIAIGFVLRLISGGVACDIELSPWIVLMTFLLTLFMAFAKRRDDVLLRERDGIVTRPNTQRYNMAFMNSVLGIIASVTMVCYIMYTLSDEVMTRFDNKYVYISCIPVLAGIIRYLQISIVDERSGNPTRVLLKDRFIQGCCVCWFAFFLILIYLMD